MLLKIIMIMMMIIIIRQALPVFARCQTLLEMFCIGWIHFLFLTILWALPSHFPPVCQKGAWDADNLSPAQDPRRYQWGGPARSPGRSALLLAPLLPRTVSVVAAASALYAVPLGLQNDPIKVQETCYYNYYFHLNLWLGTRIVFWKV